MTPSRPVEGRDVTIRTAIEAAGGIETYLAQGFLQIAYDPSVLAENVPLIIKGMQRMIDGGEADAFAADIIGEDEVGWKQDSGLYRRDVREQKWFFHYFKETYDRMAARGAPVRDYMGFFMAMDDLNQRGLEIARIAAQMIDEHHSSNGITMPSLADQYADGYALTRCLRYLKREKGKADATAHFDRSGCTTHWWGSRQGLIVVDQYGERHRVLETDFDTICIFPGKKAGGITEYRYGCGTLHGVIDAERDAGAEDDRFALVTFAHPTLTPAQATRVKEYDPTCDRIEKESAF